MLNKTELPENILNDVSGVVHSAGQIVNSYFGKKLQQVDKADGYATAADLESEKLLISGLSKILPQATFLAEESGKSAGDGEFCWVIDPLDGTTNFVQGLPYFCVSVALTKNSVPVLGVVYNPLSDELFAAQQGVGAFLNRAPISTSTRDDMKKCFFGVSFSYHTSDDYQRSWKAARLIRGKSFSMRHMGSAALDLAHVACGRLDGTFFEKLHWWDVAAGLCIANVAGAIATDFKGKSIDLGFDSCIVAPEKVHVKMLDLLKKC